MSNTIRDVSPPITHHNTYLLAYTRINSSLSVPSRARGEKERQRDEEMRTRERLKGETFERRRERTGVVDEGI